MLNSLRLALLYIIDLVFGFIEFLLMFRFIMKLFNASSSSQFVSWLYNNTSGILHPFEGAFPTTIVEGGFVIEFSTLLAIIVYGIIAYLLIMFLSSEHTQVSSSRQERGV